MAARSYVHTRAHAPCVNVRTGHCLVTPRRRVAAIADLSDEEIASLWVTAKVGTCMAEPPPPSARTALTRALRSLSPRRRPAVHRSPQQVGTMLKRFHSADALTLAIQDGAAAGQTVPHVHIHILPRHFGDFEPNDKVYDALDECDMRRGASAERGPREVVSAPARTPGKPPSGALASAKGRRQRSRERLPRIGSASSLTLRSVGSSKGKLGHDKPLRRRRALSHQQPSPSSSDGRGSASQPSGTRQSRMRARARDRDSQLARSASLSPGAMRSATAAQPRDAAGGAGAAGAGAPESGDARSGPGTRAHAAPHTPAGTSSVAGAGGRAPDELSAGAGAGAGSARAVKKLVLDEEARRPRSKEAMAKEAAGYRTAMQLQLRMTST